MSGFADNRTSGSGDVALAFLEELERWLTVDTSTSAPAVRSALLAWLRAAQAAQPTMAGIHQLAARALDVADTAVARRDPPAEMRLHLARSAAAERADLESARNAVAKTALDLLTQPEPWIATLSHSAVVRRAILNAHEAGRRPRILVGEGRPLLEGRELARSLALAGVPVWLLADAALPLLLSHASAVWLGADAVT
jgi:translation initiation factor 2B subunit (eIF-2B alpha/beta/delta family)